MLQATLDFIGAEALLLWQPGEIPPNLCEIAALMGAFRTADFFLRSSSIPSLRAW
jgi:hypothetical protein